MNESTDNAWERFARADAEHYILTDRPKYATSEDRVFFAESGRREAQALIAETAPWRSGSARALEIGCGVGRVAIPIAAHFAEVRAVDVSPTMLEKLRRNCRDANAANVRAYLPNEPWDDAPADLAYSRLVFQHIPNADVIARYLERIGRCLSPDGVASLQFDTRPATFGSRVRNRLPDRVLPRDWRRGIRRIRRSRDDVLELLEGAGLEVLAESGARTSLNVFIVARR